MVLGRRSLGKLIFNLPSSSYGLRAARGLAGPRRLLSHSCKQCSHRWVWWVLVAKVPSSKCYWLQLGQTATQGSQQASREMIAAYTARHHHGRSHSVCSRRAALCEWKISGLARRVVGLVKTLRREKQLLQVAA